MINTKSINLPPLSTLHQQPLNKRHPINHIQSQTARPRHRPITRDIIQLVQNITSTADLRIRGVPIPCIPLESEQIAHIHTMVHGVLDRLRERRHVAQTQVQALAGERVDDVRCVADESYAGRDVGGGVAEAEGEGCYAAFLDACDHGWEVGGLRGVLEAPGEFVFVGVFGCSRGAFHAQHVLEVGHGEAEGGVDHGDEGLRGEGLEVGGVFDGRGPDEGCVVVGEGEQGDGSA